MEDTTAPEFVVLHGASGVQVLRKCSSDDGCYVPYVTAPDLATARDLTRRLNGKAPR